MDETNLTKCSLYRIGIGIAEIILTIKMVKQFFLGIVEICRFNVQAL